ncbi:hypothetical protein BDV25DRAFT_165751 [Aspergillus avenaceus]|uniref:Uncharacterized protein n=1 Tax=Aspergillus avenaceus TaxID=36643 RepID=A0A5N6TFQ7_ASPAV|nr:hypothetical protein BDV25DRAFT_165751 [Aspergillus avenaceus]
MVLSGTAAFGNENADHRRAGTLFQAFQVPDLSQFLDVWLVMCAVVLRCWGRS